MIRSKTPRTGTGSGPDVQSILLHIDDVLIHSPVPDDFFPDFDRIASTLLRYDRMAISFYVNRRFQAEYAYVSGTLIENFEQGTLHVISEQTARACARRNKPFHLSGPDRQSDPVFDGFDTVARSAGLRSGMAAPIMWRGEHIGNLALRSSGEEAYTDRDLGLIDMLAGKISGVVANARAVSQARLESSLRESLLEISRLVSSVRSLDKIQRQFGEIACSLIGADRVSITVPDTPDRVINNVLVYGRDVDGYGFGSRTFLDDFDTIPWLETTNPYIVDDDLCNRSRATKVAEQNAVGAGLKSTLIAPIVWQGKSIASINFRSSVQGAFNTFHLETATSIANQVAGAIANQIAYEDLARKARERDALAHIGRTISSTDSLEATFDQFAKAVSKLIPWDRIAVTMLTGEKGKSVSVFEAGIPYKGIDKGALPIVIEELIELFGDEPAPIIIDANIEAKYVGIRRVKTFADAVGLRSWMTAPLVWRNELIGAIHFRSTEIKAYGKPHLRLAAEIANQIVGSIASNIAFQKLEEDATVRDVLAELSSAVGSSDNLAKVLPQVEKLTRSLIEFDGFTIGTYDAEHELFRHLYTEGLRSANRPADPVFHLTDLIAGDAIKTGEVQSVSFGSLDDARHSPRSIEAYKAGTRSFLTAPLISNDHVVGAMQLRSKTENAYGDQHIKLIKRIAGQFAGAFANSLATEQVRLQALALESAGNAIVIFTPDGTIEWVNPAFTKLTGWTSSEAVGQHTSNMRSVDPAKWHIDEEISANLRQGRSWNGTHINRKKDGTEYSEEITVTPVFDPDGEIIHIIGIKQDVTERILAEQQQKDAIRIESENRELQRIAAARSEFLSTVSHELRTPLTTVSAFADILFNSNSENLTDRQMTHIGLIRKSSNQLATLIDDLLDVSQADSGRLVMNKANFGLVEMVDEVADLSRVLLSERGQSLELTNLDSPMDLYADRPRVIQILTNLLTNASKFADEGSKVRFCVSTDAEHVSFTVADQGPGISRNDQAKMFSPFYRGSNPGSAETVGIGLGLSVVQSLVDLHDGLIAVSSKRGKGTSITVKLPGVISDPA